MSKLSTDPAHRSPLLLEDAVLLHEALDHLLLVAVDPSSEGHAQQPQWGEVGHHGPRSYRAILRARDGHGLGVFGQYGLLVEVYGTSIVDDDEGFAGPGTTAESTELAPPSRGLCSPVAPYDGAKLCHRLLEALVQLPA